MRSNPLVAAADAGEKEAEARIHQAHSGYLPRVQFSESLQRGNNPVFVFSSLLTQHQFSEANFAIGSLNRPDAMNNYQSQLTVEQVLFDARQTSRNVEAARFIRQMAGEDTRRSHSDIILNVLRAYFGVTLAEKNLEVARQSVDSARADLARAESIYESGRSTQADVLALRVHLAAMQEQQIRAANDSAVARAALNDALGVSLDRTFELTTPLESSVGAPDGTLEEYGRLAAKTVRKCGRPNSPSALPGRSSRSPAPPTGRRSPFRGSSRPTGRISLVKAVRTGSPPSRFAGACGTGARPRPAWSRHDLPNPAPTPSGKRTDSAIHLEVRKAYLDLKAAAQRVEVASAAAAEAEEAHRIIQNRHQAGLITVTELLRSETALAAARTRRLAAVYDHRVAAAALDHAAGTLAADSALLN